jgi:hypothetical protein
MITTSQMEDIRRRFPNATWAQMVRLHEAETKAESDEIEAEIRKQRQAHRDRAITP